MSLSMSAESVIRHIPIETKCKSRMANPPVILLVEDEPVVREVTRQVLLHGGYRVLESSNAAEALALARKHAGEIDLLLTDVIMPEMNGAELAGQLQEMQPGLLTIFMSGYAEADVARRMNRTSAIHIQKPFTVHALLSRVAEALAATPTLSPTAGEESGAPRNLPHLEPDAIVQ